MTEDIFEETSFIDKKSRVHPYTGKKSSLPVYARWYRDPEFSDLWWLGTPDIESYGVVSYYDWQEGPKFRARASLYPPQGDEDYNFTDLGFYSTLQKAKGAVVRFLNAQAKSS